MNIEQALALLQSINLSSTSVPTEVKEVDTEIEIIPDEQRFAALRAVEPRLSASGFLDALKQADTVDHPKKTKRDQPARQAERIKALQHFVGYCPSIPFGMQLDRAVMAAWHELHSQEGSIIPRKKYDRNVKGFAPGTPDRELPYDSRQELEDQEARVRANVLSFRQILKAGNYDQLRKAIAGSYVLCDRAGEVTGTVEDISKHARMFASALCIILVQELQHLNEPGLTYKIKQEMNKWDIRVPGFNDETA